MTDKPPEKDRNWDKQMRDVDRLLAKLPYADPPGAGSEATLRKAAAARPPTGPTVAGTWAKVALGLLIGIGMTQWPYTHGCGVRLGLYLIGVVAVLAAGIWSGYRRGSGASGSRMSSPTSSSSGAPSSLRARCSHESALRRQPTCGCALTSPP